MAPFHQVSNETISKAAGELASAIVGSSGALIQDIAIKYGLSKHATNTVLAKAWIEVAEQALLRTMDLRVLRTTE